MRFLRLESAPFLAIIHFPVPILYVSRHVYRSPNECSCESSLLLWVQEGRRRREETIPLVFPLFLLPCAWRLGGGRVGRDSACFLLVLSNHWALSPPSSLALTQSYFVSFLPNIQIFATSVFVGCLWVNVYRDLSQEVRSKKNSIKKTSPSFVFMHFYL